MSEEQKKLWKSRVPTIIVSSFTIATIFISLWAWVKVLSLTLTNYFGHDIYVLSFFFGKVQGVPFWLIPLVALISIYGWLLSTRVKRFKTPVMRVLIFFNMIIAIGGVLTGFGMTKVQHYVLPYFYERLDRVIETSDAIHQALFEQTQGFFFMLVMLPLIVMLFIGFFLVTRYRLHDEELKKAFFEFQWSGERLRKFENMGKVEDSVVSLPDVELGISRRTKEMVVLPGKDRTLNTIITGAIGTGKTAALALPVIQQDLDYITRFMNDFPTVSKREDYVSEDVKGRYLNGLTVIEPSNDLCQKVYKLAKAHGIPDEAITYIDPTNKNTPSINVMQGPTEKVAEVFAQVLDGLSDNGGTSNFYFEQAQRNHLKHYIYLLKMHDPKLDVTFDMLIDMYNDTKLVHEMHMKLKKRFPKDYDKIEDRDMYNYWQILKGIDQWFDNAVVPLEIKTPQGLQKVRDDNGDIRYIDAFEQDVKGLRNILNDIANNPLIRRVLFGPSKFNFDAHMGGAGGILLVNTAKGELADLSGVLGKIVLMSIQNAAFRREPYTSTYHHIVVDEAPEYLYSSFASFPAQSRKYKVIITILQQTLTQLRGAFGEDYMNTVVAAMRNRMVYADVSNFDAKYFSEMFGEKEVYREGETEQSVSPLQEDPVTRTGSTFSKTREARLTGSDILYQIEYECAVKIVVNNRTMPVEQIKANFVPKELFEYSPIQVNQETIHHWIEARFNDYESNKELIDIDDVDGVNVIDMKPENEATPTETVETVEANEPILNQEEMKKAINVHTPSKPKDSDVNYNKPSLANVTIPYASTRTTKLEDEAPGEMKEETSPSSLKENAEITHHESVEKETNALPTVENQVSQVTESKPKEDVAPLEAIVVPKRTNGESTPNESNESNETSESKHSERVEEKTVTNSAVNDQTVVNDEDDAMDFVLPRRPMKKSNKAPLESSETKVEQEPSATQSDNEVNNAQQDAEHPSTPKKRARRTSLTADIDEYKQDTIPNDVEEFYKEMKQHS